MGSFRCCLVLKHLTYAVYCFLQGRMYPNIKMVAYLAANWKLEKATPRQMTVPLVKVCINRRKNFVCLNYKINLSRRHIAICSD